MGVQAVEWAVKGRDCTSITGNMLGFKRNKGSVYHCDIITVPLSEVANQTKQFPKEWIINGNDVSDAFVQYAMPLTRGEVSVPIIGGKPRYYRLNLEAMVDKKLDTYKVPES